MQFNAFGLKDFNVFKEVRVVNRRAGRCRRRRRGRECHVRGGQGRPCRIGIAESQRRSCLSLWPEIPASGDS